MPSSRLLRYGGAVLIPVMITLAVYASPYSFQLMSRDFPSTSGRYMTPKDHYPETILAPEGIPGFNLLSNIYLRNGAFHIVTSHPEDWQDKLKGIMTGSTTPTKGHPDPGDERMRIITPDESKAVLGAAAVRQKGVSMFFNDARNEYESAFLAHYYHFLGEVFLGAWRVLTAAGEMNLPERLMYRALPNDWRDGAGLITWFQRNILPDSAIEDSFIWMDRATSDATFVFDKLTIVDRWSAHERGINPRLWNKMTADLFMVKAPSNWLEPIRKNLVDLSLANGCQPVRRDPNVPVLVYINRQSTGRRLDAQDAEGLATELQKLDDEGVVEFVDAKMESIDRVQQICLALRSDIMVGVHGNGLTHQLWMQPGSTVFEIMDVGGFIKDYEMLAELVPHTYYAIHNDSVFTEDKWTNENGQAVGSSPGFHGPNIHVSGKFISGLVRKEVERLRRR